MTSLNFAEEEFVTFKWHDSVKSYVDTHQRIKTLVRSILISTATISGPILISTHCSVMRAILCHLDFQLGLR